MNYALGRQLVYLNITVRDGTGGLTVRIRPVRYVRVRRRRPS